METAAAMLRRLTMLRGCSDEQVAELGALVHVRHLEKGEVLTTEGDTDLGAYLVIEGWASVLRGGRSIFSLGVGQFIGEMANLHDTPRSATVVAATPMTVVVIPAAHFDEFTNHPAVTQRLTESLSARVRQALEHPEQP